MSDTLNGFGEVAKTAGQKNIIVWLNEYFGEVAGNEGKPFEELRVAQQHADRLVGSITIAGPNSRFRSVTAFMMGRRRWS